MHEKIEPEIVTWLFRDMEDSRSSSSGNSGNCKCCKSDYKNENSEDPILESVSQYSEIFLKVHTLIDQKEMDVKEEDSEDSMD